EHDEHAALQDERCRWLVRQWAGARPRCRMANWMFGFRRCGAALCGVIALCATGSARAAGGGTFGGLPAIPPPPEAPAPIGAFEAPRRPPIPVSFLAHDGGW